MLFPQRSEIVLQQLRDAGLYPLVDAPTFNQHGGSVPPGFQLAISAPAGAIYFTTDGSDPRVPRLGAISATATAYTAPFALPAGSTNVKARTLHNLTWSALTEASFLAPLDFSHLKITEIMVNPTGGSDYEFIELKNIGPSPLSRSGRRGLRRRHHLCLPPGKFHSTPAAFVLRQQHGRLPASLSRRALRPASFPATSPTKANTSASTIPLPTQSST